MMTKIEYPSIGETVYECELENGLKIRAIPKPGFSSYYAVFGTNYGGAMRKFELDGKVIDTPAGIAHFLEHKMFDLPNGDNALTMLSNNGADPNAFTSSGVTCYYFRCTENFEDNLRLLLHFVSTPYFTKESVEKEQGIIGQEIRMVEDNPGNRMYYNLLKSLFDHHPIRDEVAGTVESIAEISDKTLYDCHKVFYAPSNMCLCVEGDIDVDMIEKIAREELPKEKSPVPHADYGDEEGQLPIKKKESLAMEVSAPQFFIGSKIDSLEFRQRLVSNMAIRLLLGPSSPFYSRLYSQGIINHDFDAEADYSAGTGIVIIGGESEQYEKVYEELVKEVENVNITDEYFLRTKKSAIGSRLRSFEDFENICLSTMFGVFDGYNYFESLELFDSITKEDCIDWIKRNMCEEKLSMSVITPKK